MKIDLDIKKQIVVSRERLENLEKREKQYLRLKRQIDNLIKTYENIKLL